MFEGGSSAAFYFILFYLLFYLFSFFGLYVGYFRLIFVYCHYITKTCLYNFYPPKPHFYIVKLGFTGVDIIFLISIQNIDCGYSLEPPRRGGGSNEYPQSMFWAEIFLSEIFHFLVVNFSVFLNRHVFVMFGLLLSVSLEGCASWLKPFLGNFIYMSDGLSKSFLYYSLQAIISFLFW